jgi:hypothetical protein
MIPYIVVTKPTVIHSDVWSVALRQNHVIIHSETFPGDDDKKGNTDCQFLG